MQCSLGTEKRNEVRMLRCLTYSVQLVVDPIQEWSDTFLLLLDRFSADSQHQECLL
jgi:hypothetical protein